MVRQNKIQDSFESKFLFDIHVANNNASLSHEIITLHICLLILNFKLLLMIKEAL